jgi:hypothetical protein
MYNLSLKRERARIVAVESINYYTFRECVLVA